MTQDSTTNTESAMCAPPADMAKLYGKLARVMGKCKRVKKDGENKYHGYKYATAADVADEVRGYLADENVAFFAEMGSKTVDDGVWVVTFYFTFACGDTGASVTRAWASEGAAANSKGRDDKGLNKAATTAEKYFLLKTFILSAGDEPDSDAETPQPADGKSATNGNGKKPPIPFKDIKSIELPTASGTQWTDAQWKAWAAKNVRDDFPAEAVFKALGITRPGEWAGDADSASKRLTAWMDAQHN